MTEKPPYRIPSMDEVAALKATNGLSVASTFSGCGGSCLGFEMAGYEVIWASEFLDEAREAFELNHPGVPVSAADIRTVSGTEVLAETGLRRGELDVLDGSPPCTSFSTAGKREKKWGKQTPYLGKTQRVDDLFWEFGRLVAETAPRSFVAENVSGLVKGVAKGYFLDILEMLKRSGDGYRVRARLLDAQWLGVPQRRQRLIFVGVRQDLGREPEFPTPLPHRYTLAEALPALEGRTIATQRGPKDPGRVETTDQPGATVTGHGYSNVREYQHGVDDDSVEVDPETGEPLAAPLVRVDQDARRHARDDRLEVDPETGQRIALDATAIGREAAKLAPGDSSDRYFNLVRADERQPSPTVTGTAGTVPAAGVIHPSGRRKFTLQELRRVCGFPDDFVLAGTYTQRWGCLGRAVPPPMMRAVAEALAPVLTGV